MGYDNVLFNGKSMRNAIITKLSEDKHLTSALFANSNITILVDIISYMYQCLMSNLRQAASESMWSDTIFFENATRLAKLIGYYAKGQMPYTMLAKLVASDENPNPSAPEFGNVELGYGPYNYKFAVVEHNVNNDQSLIRLALGDWVKHKETLISDGTKFQEFVIERNLDETEQSTFISQKYVRVYSTLNGVKTDWTYSANPLFLLPKIEESNQNAVTTRNRTAETLQGEANLFNFYINENGDYILKFGDGISTAIPENGSEIHVMYVTSTETDRTITPAIKSALSNAEQAKINLPADSEIDDPNVFCIPYTTLEGYRDKDNPESIRRNSRNAFSRQNRLVTKEDYHNFILENYPEYKDVAIQNNWEYVSSFYGWLYTTIKSRTSDNDPSRIFSTNNLEKFNSSDLADANNVYIWVLNKTLADINNVDVKDYIGIVTEHSTGTAAKKFGNSIETIKEITVQPIFINALCKRFVPYARTNTLALSYDTPDPFENSEIRSFFRIHIDSNYANSINIIKTKTYNLIKEYLFDNIMLGYTPNVPALIKDLMSIDGIINISTVYNATPNKGTLTEEEVNGMQFATWTDTNNNVIDAGDDAKVAFNLPNIPCFQFFKATQPFNEFILKSLEFKVEYSINSI